MAVDWKSIFDNYGEKRVTKNDKNKGAYVPIRSQSLAIEAAGIEPLQGVGFGVTVLFDSSVRSVDASYYYAARSAEAGRPPEPRMGREFISSWLSVGDRVLIGNVGPQVFAVKLQAAPVSNEDVVAEVARLAKREAIIERAKKAKGKPARRTVQREDFVRDPFVVAAALIRSVGECEMPKCTRDLFLKDDGSPYLEVHHIHPLAEGGDDTLVNAAVLCPHCHRLLHFGVERNQLRSSLAAHIGAKST